MKTVLIATAWLVLLVQAAGAVVVSNTNILLGDGSDLGADFRLTVFQDEGGDGWHKCLV